MIKTTVLISLLSLALPTLSQSVLVVVDDYSPYIDKSKSNNGFMTEIVVKAFELSGIQPKIEFRPWKRIEEVEIDKMNALSFAWIKTEERQNKWLFSDNIMSATTVFITLKGSRFSWKTIDDLKPYRIGISRGYSYGEAFDKRMSEFQVFEAANDEQNIRKLVAKRIDIYPVDPYVGAQFIREKLTPDEAATLEVVSTPSLSDDSMHAICAKSYSDCESILNKFNAGLAKMRENGALKSIIDKATSLY